MQVVGTCARFPAVKSLAYLFALMPLPASASFMMSVAPLRAICQEVALQAQHCELLLEPGVSPHTYEPRPRDIRAVGQAKALFFVSALLDGWVTKLPAARRVMVIDWLPAELRLTLSHDDHGDHTHHAHSGNERIEPVDPHFWLDPLAVQAILPKFAAKFCEFDAVACQTYHANATRFAAELQALDTEIRISLNPVKGAALLVYHPFLAYFAKRYGLMQVAAIESSPGKEPTPRVLKDTIALVKRSKAKIIVVSPEIPQSAAKAVAEAAGIKIVVIDDLGGTPGRQRYHELIRYNAKVLLEALR